MPYNDGATSVSQDASMQQDDMHSADGRVLLASEREALQSNKQQQVQQSNINSEVRSKDGRVLLASERAAIQQPTQPPTTEGQSTFMDGITAFNRSFANMAEGAIQGTAQILGAKGIENLVGDVHKQGEADLRAAQQRSPMATTIGGALGSIGAGAYAAPYMGSPVGVLGLIGRGAAAGAGLGVIQYANNNTDRAINAGLGGALGGILGPAANAANAGKTAILASGLGAIGGSLLPSNSPGQTLTNIAMGGLLGAGAALSVAGVRNAFRSETPASTLSKYLTPVAAAQQDIGELGAQHLQGSGRSVADILAQAKDVGQPITAAEGIGGVSLNSLAGNIPKYVSSVDDTRNMLTQRENNISAQVKDIINNFTPAGRQATEDLNTTLRAGIQQTAIPEPLQQDLMHNSTLAAQVAHLKQNPLSPSQLAPINQLSMWDEIKQNLDSYLWNKTYRLKDSTVDMLPGERQVIMNARNLLVNKLNDVPVDTSGATYSDARKVSQSLILQDNINRLLSETATSKGNGGELTVDDYFKTLFNTDAKKSLFLDHVEELGGNAAQASKLINVISQIYKSSSKNALDIDPAINSGANPFIVFTRAARPHEYFDALNKIMIDPEKWGPAVQAVIDAPKSDKPSALNTLVNKALSSNVAKGAAISNAVRQKP